MSKISVFIDDSDDYLAIMIGSELVVNHLVRPIRQSIGKTVHMKELKKSLKLRTARLFVDASCKLRETYNLRLICGKRNKVLAWINKFITTSVSEKVELPIFYVDISIKALLRKKIHPYYFRFLTIYEDKDKTQGADILAWINLRRAQSSFIWTKIATCIEEIESA